jgi:hypothetical protein
MNTKKHNQRKRKRGEKNLFWLVKSTMVGSTQLLLFNRKPYKYKISFSKYADQYKDKSMWFSIHGETYLRNNAVDKFIVETPAQIAADIGVERTRAQGIEQSLQNQIGNLENLTTPVTSNLVASDNSLQSQIDAIVAKTDVVDVVSCYDRGSDTSKSDVVHYPTADLGNNDILKVLVDETHDDEVSYYRWVLNNPQDPSQGGTWNYIGSVGEYYTRAQADERFVHLDQSESIQGTKTFLNRDLYIKSSTLDRTDATQTGYLHLGFKDKNDIELGHVKSILDNGKITTNLAVTTNPSSNAYAGIDVTYDTTTNVLTTSAQTPTSDVATSTTSKQIATVGWVNTVGNNVVHLSGTETIAGSKTFSGTIIVPTPTANSHAATKKYVDDVVSGQTQIPSFGPSDAYSCLAVSQSGDSLFWRPVRDLTKLNDLDDTVVSNPSNGQTLVWDSSAASGGGAWVNSNQVSATIKYW